MKPILATIALLLAVNGMLHGQAVRTCTPQDWSGCVAGGVPKCDPYIRNKDGWIIGHADCAAVVSGCIHAQTKPSKKSDAHFKKAKPCPKDEHRALIDIPIQREGVACAGTAISDCAEHHVIDVCEKNHDPVGDTFPPSGDAK